MNEKKAECISLATDIIDDFELSRLPVGKILLKCQRLCRLLDDDFGRKLFFHETTGYSYKNGLPQDIADIARFAGRATINNEGGESFWIQSIQTLESKIESNKIRLSVASDPDISISSVNPNQTVIPPIGNKLERSDIINGIIQDETIAQKVLGNLYQYIINIYYKLKYEGMIDDIFSQNVEDMTYKIGNICPTILKKVDSISSNITSENPEDWANAVHSCRRMLKDLADVLYPPHEAIQKDGKTIKLGEENYINRLIQYIDACLNKGKTFKDVIITDLESIGKRLDAIYDATNKGTHAEVSRDESKRYIMHTYFLISDILSLKSS